MGSLFRSMIDALLLKKGLVGKVDHWAAGRQKSRLGAWRKPKAKMSRHRQFIKRQKRIRAVKKKVG